LCARTGFAELVPAAIAPTASAAVAANANVRRRGFECCMVPLLTVDSEWSGDPTPPT
jgi:hypothetical protein